MSLKCDGSDLRDCVLYERLLGADWQRLDGAIRRMHSPGLGLHATGVFKVVHGRHRAARLLAKLLRLPVEAEKADVRLHVKPSGPAELWIRTFERRCIVTRQSGGTLGILRENTGWLELQFRLMVERGSLVYRQSRAGLRIGWWFVPLPGWISPTVEASEKTGDRPNAVYVSVTFRLPGGVLLMSYSGRIEAQETEA
jgi:uncharacterized protein DUF4166